MNPGDIPVLWISGDTIPQSDERLYRPGQPLNLNGFQHWHFSSPPRPNLISTLDA